MNSVLAILIGLMSGAAMSVAVSSVWCVLHLPARIQHLLHAASPRMMGLALLSAGEQDGRRTDGQTDQEA